MERLLGTVQEYPDAVTGFCSRCECDARRIRLDTIPADLGGGKVCHPLRRVSRT